jgi:hypothetical protein
MATLQHYAQLSNRAYTRSDANRTPVPEGWTELDPKPEDHFLTGFSAGVYLSDGGTELVISFIAKDQLWFSRVNNDLIVSIIGTSDSIKIQDWYLGGEYGVDKFQTADSSILLQNQVEQLRSAMASFAPPAPGQFTLPSELQEALGAVIAQSWAA